MISAHCSAFQRFSFFLKAFFFHWGWTWESAPATTRMPGESNASSRVLPSQYPGSILDPSAHPSGPISYTHDNRYRVGMASLSLRLCCEISTIYTNLPGCLPGCGCGKFRNFVMIPRQKWNSFTEMPGFKTWQWMSPKGYPGSVVSDFVCLFVLCMTLGIE